MIPTNHTQAYHLLNQAPCGLIIMKINGVVLHLNDTLKNWLGYDEGNSFPMPIHFYDLLSIGSKIYCETHYFPMLQMHSSVKEINLEMKQKTGGKIPVLINTVSVINEKGEAEYHAIVIDITHRKLYEKELLLNKRKSDAMIADLEKKNSEISNFAHTVAHDLKSPLRNMLGLISLVAEGLKDKLPADEADYLRKAIQRGDYMANFIDSLLAFASSGEGQSQAEAVDLEALFSDIQSNLERSITESEASLDVSKAPCSVWGNRIELIRLFQNLVENAIKYRRSWVSLTIQVKMTLSAESVLVEIADNGMGIPPEYVSSIFNPFTRAHANTSVEKGSGIGLATCKKIVLAHHGEIWVESTLNQGSTFYVKLPRLAHLSPEVDESD